MRKSGINAVLGSAHAADDRAGLARAGQRALDSLAPAEAVRLFGDAVKLLGSGDTVERCQALIGLGEAQRLTGDAGSRETLLEASRIASTVNDAELAAKAALANSSGLVTVIGESDMGKLAAIERALVLDDGSDLGRRARLCALNAMELLFDPAEVEHRGQGGVGDPVFLQRHQVCGPVDRRAGGAARSRRRPSART